MRLLFRALGGLSTERGSHRREVGSQEADASAGVAQDVRKLGGAVPVIERNQDRTATGGGVVRRRPGRRVATQQSHPVSRPDAKRQQPPRELVGLPVEGGVADRLPFV